MIFYIVRHGKPDYETNTLLPEGREQAELAAERLARLPISRIYSSPYGRAVETAEPLARRLNLPIRIENWAYELENDCDAAMEDGSRVPLTQLRGTFYRREKFDRCPAGADVETNSFYPERFRERYREITAGLDSLLDRLGYRRNADGFYDVVQPNDEYICLFCHGAMERVMLSHLFRVPFHVLAGSTQPQLTGITTLCFENNQGPEIMPMLYSFSDYGHLYNKPELPTHYITGQII